MTSDDTNWLEKLNSKNPKDWEEAAKYIQKQPFIYYTGKFKTIFAQIFAK